MVGQRSAQVQGQSVRRRRAAVVGVLALALGLIGVGLGFDTVATATVGASSFNAEDKTLDASGGSRTVRCSPQWPPSISCGTLRCRFSASRSACCRSR